MYRTALGRLGRYFVDSYRFATQKAAEVRPTFRRVLNALAVADRGEIKTGNVEEVTQLAVVNSWVYSDIKLIADRVSSYKEVFTVEEFTGKRKGAVKDSETIEDHPLLEVWDAPNPLMSAAFLIRYTSWWFNLLGNAFLYLVPEKEQGQGPIREIWPLPAMDVSPIPDSLRNSELTGLPIIDYEYRIGGQMEMLRGENVVHIRTPNPFDYWVGLSPLTALQLPLRTDYSQSFWLDSFFGEDNAIPSSVISVPADLDDDDFDAVREELKIQFSGGRRTAITRAGDISVELLQHAVSELRVLEGREFNQKEIDRVYAVPEGLITGGLSGDSRLAAEMAFARNAIQPMLNLLIADFAIKAIPFYMTPDQPNKITLVPVDIVPQDRALNLSEYGGYKEELTTNEARQMQDKDLLIFEGDFADLQPLLDEIPIGLLGSVGAAIIDKWNMEFNPPPEDEGLDFGFGGGSDFDSWFTELEGSVDANSQNGTGQTEESDEASFRESGQPTQEQTMEKLSKGLTPDEVDALVQVVRTHTNGHDG